MRIVLAPDKFKGTFTAAQVCDHLRAGIRQADPSIDIVVHPLADGGEGTLDVILGAIGGRRVPIESVGPLGGAITANVGVLSDDTVLVESARFCGLDLVPPEKRDPLRATAYSLGRALASILSRRPPLILIGLGGSATVDGGTGMARALGFALLAADGAEIENLPFDLQHVASIRRPSRALVPPGCRIEALCDVANPLTGPEGAVAAFAPQKGASSKDLLLLDAGLARLAVTIERDLGVQVASIPGGGAAGGLGAGLRAFLGAGLSNGAREVMALTGFDQVLCGADLVVTGEGSYDAGSRKGKVVTEVIRLADEMGVPVVVVCGRASEKPAQTSVRVLVGGGLMGPEEFRNAGKHLVTQGLSGGSVESPKKV